MSEDAAPRGQLAAKLAQVQLEVEQVAKRGYNDHHHYSYATEADILRTVREELASRKVVLFPEVIDQEMTANNVTLAGMRFTWVDAETGETQECYWAGQGADKQDKGIYKAITGGVKYFLLKSFLIPTGDDPENPAAEQTDTGSVPATDQKREEQPREQRGGQRLASEKQVKLIRYRADEKGIDTPSLGILLEHVAGVESADAVPQRMVDPVLKAIEES